ncbi:glycosyltransferase family 2 protein [Salipiger sp. 1_MG-2023]|uniref:glycosyltransferase family 2 protein n=1 Tax=Salipiger sp. 1_MG-2023 TaxID=3062665 RepID=UPI0026E2272B|nr:glycosyltransferase family 2 protein [Salipiger sp. 1_MG-2023]MDO6585000.1 glycosyltransferase family 2 protein [Salipiger sp. 1_MG-2023]
MSVTWGTVTTTNAPLPRILDFAAWHLELGARRVYLYLDEDMPEAQAVLSAHPKLRVFRTDEAWWAKRGRRPVKHQARQGANARHANNRKPEVDWLAHIDTDEFLLPARPLAEQLAALPPDCLCARVRPIEALVSDGPETLFKACPQDQRARQEAAQACFPTWGAHLSGGFLSHVAGKLLFRAGTPGLQIRIHNVTLGDVDNPGMVRLADTELGHFHAGDWAHFLSLYRFRLAQGSYRSELKPQARTQGALSLHDLFALIEQSGGEDALRRFHTEVCTARPELLTRLDGLGLLRRHRMGLSQLRARHFPDAA